MFSMTICRSYSKYSPLKVRSIFWHDLNLSSKFSPLRPNVGQWYDVANHIEMGTSKEEKTRPSYLLDGETDE
jgi:hypothetical protein